MSTPETPAREIFKSQLHIMVTGQEIELPILMAEVKQLLKELGYEPDERNLYDDWGLTQMFDRTIVRKKTISKKS